MVVQLYVSIQLNSKYLLVVSKILGNKLNCAGSLFDALKIAYSSSQIVPK